MEYNGDRLCWSRFEFVFTNWFSFMYERAEDGAVATTALPSKTDEQDVRCMKALLASLGYDEVDLKTGNEVSIVAMAEKVKATRSPFVTKLRLGGFYEHRDLGPVKRMHQTVQVQVRATQFDFQEQAKIRLPRPLSSLGWLGTQVGA